MATIKRLSEMKEYAEKFRNGDYAYIVKPYEYSPHYNDWLPQMDNLNGKRVQVMRDDPGYLTFVGDILPFKYNATFFRHDFKKGDRVIIHQPEYEGQGPTWVDDMDEYDGREAIISCVDNTNHWATVNIDDSRFWYDFRWFEMVREDEVELEDDDLLSFLEEFAIGGDD